MENKSKIILKGSLLAGSIISLGALQVQAEDLVRAENLGSGGEIRATLLASERIIDNAIELKCGEKKEEGKGSKKKTETKSENKAEEHKCGEGKCGEGEKKLETKSESKSKEHKCGEAAPKKEAKSESKAEEHKCGEGKCGM